MIAVKKKLTARKLKKTLFIVAVLAYPMLLFAVFYIGINLNAIFLAFETINFDQSVSFAGFKNFQSVFQAWKNDELLKLSFFNSLKIYALTFVIGMPLTFLFSYYIFRKFFATKTIRVVIMLPAMISGLVMCLMFLTFAQDALPIVLTKLFRVASPPNLLKDERYVFGMITFYSIWQGFGMGLIMYCNAMNAIEDSVLESARLDGCNSLQELWHIILPLIYPTVTVFVVTGISGIFGGMGPLYLFYELYAPPRAYLMGYYVYVKTMTVGDRGYPFISALGLLLTFLMVPVTLGVKYFMEKLDPIQDKGVIR